MQENRAKIIQVRLNDFEFNEFKKRSANGNLSSLIRETVLQQKTVKHVPKCDSKLIFLIAKIGSNMNQIARVLNYSSKAGADFDIMKCLIELNSIHQKLDQIIENQEMEYAK